MFCHVRFDQGGCENHLKREERGRSESEPGPGSPGVWGGRTVYFGPRREGKIWNLLSEKSVFSGYCLPRVFQSTPPDPLSFLGIPGQESLFLREGTGCCFQRKGEGV